MPRSQDRGIFLTGKASTDILFRGTPLVTGFNHYCMPRLKAHGIAFHIDDVPLAQQRQMFFKDSAGNELLHWAFTYVILRRQLQM